MMKPTDKGTTVPAAGKRAWTRPTLKYVGHVGDVLQGGGGKLTPSPADSGESRKPPGVGGEGQ